jgi:hypothetical protein
LLVFTSLVYFASRAASGTSMIETEPRRSWVFLPSATGRGWLRAPTPLTLATNSFLPSAERRSAPGYQAVGISPATALRFGRPAPAPSDTFSASRTTATQLFIPLVTYRVAPSGASASAVAPLPNGSRASGRQGIVSTTSSRVVSMTLTVSLLALAT